MSIHTHACHAHLCLCLNAQVRIINFPHLLSFLFSLSFRWISHKKAIPNYKSKKIFPLAQERKRKSLDHCSFPRPYPWARARPQRGHLFAFHTQEKGPWSWASSHMKILMAQHGVGGVGDRTEGTVEISELNDHVQRWPMPSSELYPTWGKKLQEWLRLYFLPAQWNRNSRSKKLSLEIIKVGFIYSEFMDKIHICSNGELMCYQMNTVC